MNKAQTKIVIKGSTQTRIEDPPWNHITSMQLMRFITSCCLTDHRLVQYDQTMRW